MVSRGKPQVTASNAPRVFVVINPVAGMAGGQDALQILRQSFAGRAESVEIYETTGTEDVAEVVTEALAQDYNLIVAVGGDGTVSGVAGALVHTDVPLGIVPAGTGNGLARTLGIPLDPDEAAALLIAQHDVMAIDVMQVGEQIFLLNVGVGVTSAAVHETSRDVKRRLGRSAYIWGTLKQLAGFQPQRFALTVDGRRYRLRASEVLITNGLDIYAPPLGWGPAERFYDGKLDVYVIRAQSFVDYMILAGNTLLRRPRSTHYLRYLSVRDAIEISAGRVLPVQADGDVIGQTPIQVQILPGALQVILPAA